MKLATVTGTVVSTVKYEKYVGLKLLRVRPLTLAGEAAGEELVALDAVDAGLGDTVLLNNDGGAAQMVMDDREIIASVTVCGIVDAYTVGEKTVKCH